MGTYVNNTLERAEGSGDRTKEDALKKTRLANENLEQVLVNDDKLDSVSTRHDKREFIDRKTYVGESIANLLLSSSIGVGSSAIHVLDIGTGSGNDTLEARDEIVEVSAATAGAGAEERNAVHRVDVVGDGGEALGLLGNCLDGCDHLIGSDCALLDGAGRGGGGEEGHDGGEERREVHLGRLLVGVVCWKSWRLEVEEETGLRS
jgi:hypothetical protein